LAVGEEVHGVVEHEAISGHHAAAPGAAQCARVGDHQVVVVVD